MRIQSKPSAVSPSGESIQLQIKGLTHLGGDSYELAGVTRRNVNPEMLAESLDGATSELMDKIQHLVWRHDITEIFADRICG